MQISCPSCGGRVDFKSRSSVFQVCTYCSSMLVRTDMDLELVGKMAQLPPDMSPFQVGTSGKFDNKHFQILGKQRLSYDGGFWNEWYVAFDDGRTGWLGEAQGFLMMSFPVTGESIPDIKSMNPGRSIQILGKSFEIEDIKEVTCLGGLGELPVRSEKGRKFTSVDLVGENNTFSNIVFDNERSDLYLGKYVEFEELHFSGLREIDGW